MRHIGQTGIYCIENKITHQKYIGQSYNIKDRFYKHKNSLKRGKNDNHYLQESYNEYGIDNFDFYVLEECDLGNLDERERYYIKKYNTIELVNGFNLISGGRTGGKHNQETVEKCSIAIKNSYIDNPDLKETRRMDALKQWANPEIKAKIMGVNNGMYGKKHTDEAKRKISNAHKGQINWRRNLTPVFCEELNRYFKDATTAGQELLIDGSAILKVCKGQRKTCGGYHWNFVTN